MADTNAQIYTRHRPRYPQGLIDDLRRLTVGDRGERLIDWGCGTGELTLPLSPFFDDVIAVDVSAERIEIAKERAQREGIDNVDWRVGQAESVDIAPESCDLITSASAFHWMDRELLSRRAFEGLRSNGAVAIVGGAGADIWSCKEPWHRVAVDCLRKYLDGPQGGEAGASEASPGAAPQAAKTDSDVPQRKKWHGEFLTAAGFVVESRQYPTEFSWRVDQVAGYMYSITGGLPWNLGDKRSDFECEFSEALSRQNPSGSVSETIDFFLLIAKIEGD